MSKIVGDIYAVQEYSVDKSEYYPAGKPDKPGQPDELPIIP